MQRPRIRRPRARFLLLAGFSLLLALVLARALLAPMVARRLHRRLVAAAASHGFLLQLDDVHVGFCPVLQLKGLLVDHPSGLRAHADRIDIGIAPWGSGWIGPLIRVNVERLTALVPGRGRLSLAPSSWDARIGRRAFSARLRRRNERLEIRLRRGAFNDFEIRASRLKLSQILDLSIRNGVGVGLGVVDGEAFIRKEGHGVLRVVANAQSRDAVLSGLGRQNNAEGTPTDVVLQLAALWRYEDGSLILSYGRLAAGGATILARARAWGGTRDPHVDIEFDVERIEFARILATAGLESPAGSGDLGSATLGAHIAGRLSDPRSFQVEQRLEFSPPRTLPPALLRLRGPFQHTVMTSRGRSQRIDVSPDSPDFIAYDELPPLFVRMLLLSEDVNFFGHRGIDIAEVPGAVATNWKRGTTARGASTITQQLAKNVFLTREKSLSRKLQEAALALLIESTLSKQRILEIYLNIIEWGPELYGLRPAARHYFGREPADLTTKQMAFLVAMIPGPIKYQLSIKNGELSPAFESLVLGLLGKLRSVEALTEDEYQAALFEKIVLFPDTMHDHAEAPNDDGRSI
jgi:hypothetical protein